MLVVVLYIMHAVSDWLGSPSPFWIEPGVFVDMLWSGICGRRFPRSLNTSCCVLQGRRCFLDGFSRVGSDHLVHDTGAQVALMSSIP